MNSFKKLSYIKSLDGVRGCAALMVLVFHFTFNGSIKYSKGIILIRKLTEFGQHGVSLFFVLSGFLISRILLESKKGIMKDYFKNFFIRRSLRIFPLYYLYLFIHYFILPDVFERNFVEFKHQLPYYLYYQNFDNIFKFC